MNKSIFNSHRDVRIDRVKAHHIALKEQKPELLHNTEIDHLAPYVGVPWEIKNVKGLARGKIKKKIDKKFHEVSGKIRELKD